MKLINSRVDVENATSHYHFEGGAELRWNWSDNSEEWYLNDKLHREDGPAVEYSDGTKQWYLNGERHREDGPAIESADGTKHWYLNGEQLSEQQFLCKAAAG